MFYSFKKVSWYWFLDLQEDFLKKYVMISVGLFSDTVIVIASNFALWLSIWDLGVYHNSLVELPVILRSLTEI